ncbi:hypothetical protein WICMUC_005160 [Wickerhamomyces mucosus]|uniref:PQ-loop-domain-containing protein n=1 Tax=Wickerhamomyces mucosus TaxID=1378264 RepID=A0A9P8P9P9_9ASCO|nr:hypothetical protein WICMUC_005160 [Wickerhamomyces mucosus]
MLDYIVNVVPHFSSIVLDNKAVSGITGSISIALWFTVYGVEIFGIYMTKVSALSPAFIILWLFADSFNAIGAWMTGSIITMVALAVFYIICDLILLYQVHLYRDVTIKIDPIHLSPANPLTEEGIDQLTHDIYGSDSNLENQPLLLNDNINNSKRREKLKNQRTAILQGIFITTVILSSLIGWYTSYDPNSAKDPSQVKFDLVSQILGYISALLYLGSRIPQIVQNIQRQSCEGISLLFFFAAVLGNVFYVISILAISLDPKYLAVQFSWLTGSIGTLILDFIIFCQFFYYNNSKDENDDDDNDYSNDDSYTSDETSS